MPNLAVAQSQPSHVAVALTGGKVIPTVGSPFSGNSPTVGLDAALFWRQDDQQRYWTYFWHQPDFGLRANYAHVANGIAGDRLGIAATFQAPIVRHIDWVYSVGLSFYTRPYSLTHNPDNSYIGSVANCLIDFGLVAHLPFDGNYDLFLSGKVVHSSNGYLYKPNHGLNYLQAELGCNFGPIRKTLDPLDTDSLFVPYGRFFLAIAPGAAMSRHDPIDKIVYYPTYMSQIGYIRYPHPCFALGGAMDLSYNFSHRSMASSDEWPVYPALSFFGDCLWGPVVLRLGVAHYLSYYPQNWFQYYERVALYYRFGADMRQRAGIGMKVHGDHIDFVEWTYIIEL